MKLISSIRILFLNKGEDKVENSKKNLIKQSAVVVFAQEGYHETTVEEIAQEAEIAVGTIYNYFTNKQEILEYIFEVELKKRITWLKEVKEEKSSLEEQFAEFLERHFTELEANPAAEAVLMQEGRLPTKHKLKKVERFGKQLPVLFAEMIERAKDRGEVRDINSQLIATAIFEACHGVSRSIYKENYDSEWAKQELVKFYLSGLKK